MKRVRTYSTRGEAIQREIIEVLGVDAGDYDIEAIADEVLGDYKHGYAVRVSVDDYWESVRRHDKEQHFPESS